MTVAQREHADSFTKPAPEPEQGIYDRFFDLLRDRNSDLITARTRRMQIRDHDNRHWEFEAQASDRRKKLDELLVDAEARRARTEKTIDDFILAAAEEIKAERAALEVTT